MKKKRKKTLKIVPLKKWGTFCKLVSTLKDETIKTEVKKHFPGGVPNVDRFAWRYRLAKSFKSIEVENMGKPTMEGYSSIFKLFLIYSAWETYHVKVLNIHIGGATFSTIVKNRKTFSSKEISGLIDFLNEELNNDLKKAINTTLSTIDYELFARSIRHIFAHGNLTFNKKNAIPSKTKSICNLVSRELLSIMDRDFTERVDQLRKTIKTG